VRSAIAQIPGTQDVEVLVKERMVRFRFDAQTTPLQVLIAAIEGKDRRFPARLALQAPIEAPPADLFERARQAVLGIEGVRALSSPSKDGIALATFHEDKRTLLFDLLQAAQKAGLALRDPKLKGLERAEPRGLLRLLSNESQRRSAERLGA
jgi:hypothetical protein